MNKKNTAKALVIVLGIGTAVFIAYAISHPSIFAQPVYIINK